MRKTEKYNKHMTFIYLRMAGSIRKRLYRIFFVASFYVNN